MEILFNELSQEPVSTDPYKANIVAEQMVKAFAEAKKRGVERIRSEFSANQILLAENYTLHDWMFDNRFSPIMRQQFFGVFITPFIDEDHEGIEEKYVLGRYFFENLENGIPKTEKCYGLAAAHLYETLTISLPSMGLWKQVQLEIQIEANGDRSVETVWNIAEKRSFSNEHLAAFVESLGKVELMESPTLPEEKEVKLAGDHHGKRELETLAEKLRKSPYVEVIRSTDWGGSNFIRRVYGSGEVEIVLTDTTERYALWVKTTGRNKRETQEIAEKLEQKYS